MNKFNMEFKEPSEDLVLTCIDKVLETKPTLAKQYSVLATILRKRHKLNVKRLDIQKICEKYEELEPLVSEYSPEDELRDLYEDTTAEALVQNSESPFVDEKSGFEQDLEFQLNNGMTEEGHEIDDPDNPAFWRNTELFNGNAGGMSKWDIYDQMATDTL